MEHRVSIIYKLISEEISLPLDLPLYIQVFDSEQLIEYFGITDWSYA